MGRTTKAPKPAGGGPQATQFANLPTQAASIVWADPGSVGPAITYAYPGALVVAGRDQYADPVFKTISGAGGTVLIYLDALINSTVGTYHGLLLNSSIYGAAVPLWPPGYTVNSAAGYSLNDFRTTADGGAGLLLSKLPGVLEQMVSDNPHIGGFFMDDLGTRSWYPDLNWTSFPDKAKWRNGAIAIAQAVRNVCDEHGIIFMVNGTWTANDGGGYPDSTQHGCSLAEANYVEHHDTESSFWVPYVSSSQWATASKVTRGVSFAFANMNTSAGFTEFQNTGAFSFLNLQPTANYDYAAPWGTHHTTGLPSHVVS